MSALTFLQNAPPTPGTDGVTHLSIKCYNCNVKGHYADVCPSRDGVTLLEVEPDVADTIPETTDNAEAKDEESQEEEDDKDDGPYVSEFTLVNTTDNFGFHQSANIIPKSWILLDSQSTMSVFKNRRLLSNIIRDSTTRLPLLSTNEPSVVCSR